MIVFETLDRRSKEVIKLEIDATISYNYLHVLAFYITVYNTLQNQDLIIHYIKKYKYVQLSVNTNPNYFIDFESQKKL